MICGKVRSEGLLCRDKLKYSVLRMVVTEAEIQGVNDGGYRVLMMVIKLIIQDVNDGYKANNTGC